MESAGLFEREALLNVLDNDEELLGEIVRDYLADSQRILAEISALIGRVGRSDDYELQRLAHTLKGSSASIRAQQVWAAAARLEQSVRQQGPLDLTELRGALGEFAAHVRGLGLVN